MPTHTSFETSARGLRLSRPEAFLRVCAPPARMRIFRNFVKDLLDFAEPEFQRNFLVFPPNPQLQQVAGLLFLEPALQQPWNFPTVPVDDDVSGPQAGLGRKAFGVYCCHNQQTARIALRRKAQRRPPAYDCTELQACEREDLLIGKRFGTRNIFLDELFERLAR